MSSAANGRVTNAEINKAVGNATREFMNKHGFSTPRSQADKAEFQSILQGQPVRQGRRTTQGAVERPLGEDAGDLKRALDLSDQQSLASTMEYTDDAARKAEQKSQERAEKEAKKAAEKAKKAAAGKKRGQSPASQQSPNKKSPQPSHKK